MSAYHEGREAGGGRGKQWPKESNQIASGGSNVEKEGIKRREGEILHLLLFGGMWKTKKKNKEDNGDKR